MGSRILLADDSITIQKVVNLTFQDEGIEVVSVSNGDMAERRLKEVNPDLVLADIFMPGKNGYELCESIKQDPELRMVPVVLLVGAFEPFNEAEARRVHADAHLTKPFESRVLVETVRTLMDKYPKPQPAPVATQAVPEAAAFPTAQAIANPPFNLDAALMGEGYPQGLGNADFPPLHNQPLQPEAAFTDPAPAADFSDPAPFTNSFPSAFENHPVPAPTFTIEDAARVQNDFSAMPTPGTTQPIEGFASAADDFQTPLAHEETPLQLDEPVNLNPELLSFYEQYDKSPSQAEKTQVLGSAPPQGEANKESETAFDLVVDFDQVENFEESTPDNVVGFDVDSLAVTSKADDVATEQPKTFTDPTAAARKFDTNELESVSTKTTSPKGYQPVAPANNSHASFQNDFAQPRSAVFPEPSSPAEILATDEPLGDVLTSLPSLESVRDTINSASPLELDDPYLEPAVVRYKAPESVDLSTTATPQVVEAVPVETAAKRDEAPVQTEVASQEPKSFSESAVSSPVSPDTFNPADASLVHSPVAEALAPVEEPVLQRVTATEPPSASFAAKTPSPYNGLDKARSDADNLLAEFTPVNLEAVVPQSTVSESATQEPIVETSSEPLPASQALAEQDSVPEHPSSTESVAVNHQGGDMSQEMIDEIVRRVVAQLSESVVREIAWEVVPDCVERVVNNLTREGMNNKLAN